MKLSIPSDPLPLERTIIISGEGKPKRLVSINGVRHKEKSIIYLGLHGATIRIEMSDADADILLDLLEAMSQAS